MIKMTKQFVSTILVLAVRKPSQAKEGSEMKKRIKTISSMALAAMLVLTVTQNSAFATDQVCSNASLKGSYGRYASGTVVPAGTPRVGLARETYDGKGNWTNAITLNNNGTVIPLNDSGSYTVNADCTGRIFNTASGVIVQFVLVDGGKEIYSMALTCLGGACNVSYGVAKKQFPDDNKQD